MNKTIPILFIVLVVAGFGAWWQFGASQPVVEDTGNELQKADLIRITSPRPNQVISSPLIIIGEARGNWYFEASFPVVLVDWDGKTIAQGIATAKGNWMTADFVPFEATLEFVADKNSYSNRGSLILKKDNPSGLPEYDDALEVPIVFATTYPPVSECIKDSDCPSAFECVQGCGPPVARQDDPPPAYFCQLKGYIRMCPICLAKGTVIDTPLGAISVQDIQVHSPVWTQNASGMRVVGIVVKTSKTPVPPTHKMVVLVLADGRTLLVSPGHPTIDGRTVGDLAEGGDFYDGSRVVTTGRVVYSDGATYDILPSGETGFYWANGVLLGSTLR